jgi:hypothetical protein
MSDDLRANEEQSLPNEPTSTEELTNLQKKYGNDWRKAEEGYFNAVNLIKELRDKLEDSTRRMDEQQNQMVQLADVLAGNRQSPSANRNARSAVDALAQTLVVDKNLFEQAMNEAAEKMFDAKLGPMAASYKADEQMTQSYGDKWVQNRTNVLKFINEKPEYKAIYEREVQNGNPLIAQEWALLKWQNEEAPLKPNNTIAQAKIDASVGGGTKVVTSADEDLATEYNKLRAEAEITKDNTKLITFVMRNVGGLKHLAK